jgi:hypothetical protein
MVVGFGVIRGLLMGGLGVVGCLGFFLTCDILLWGCDYLVGIARIYS